MPETVICTYRVKPGKVDDFLPLLDIHWRTLNELDLVLPESRIAYRGLRDPTVVEIFTWKDGGPETAHHAPAVLAIWEPMGQLCEGMDFPHVERIRG
jgi:hypothetical protein